MDAGRMDAGRIDAGIDAGVDSGIRDGGGLLAADASLGDDCIFNFQCAADHYCACSETIGCSCQVGGRGAVGLGEACTDNADCLNGSCLDVNDAQACSMPCETLGADSPECGGMLPNCDEVPFFARACSSSTVAIDAGS